MVVEYFTRMKKGEEQRQMRRPSGFGSILTNERNYVKEYENFLKSRGMRADQSTWNTFLERYKDETKELRNENYHDYLRHKGLSHHLSESQIIEKNRESQGHNAMGLMSNLAPVAMTLSAMVGANYLINRGIDNGRHQAEHAWYNHLRENPQFVARQQALSGENSHYEALPPSHINSDGYNQVVNNAVNVANRILRTTGSNEAILNRMGAEGRDIIFDRNRREELFGGQDAERVRRDMIQAERLKEMKPSDYSYLTDIGL
tara:strand:- start:139 stop:918 length:780 start_codon:yes stop_codon:yes gene_type:complete